MVSKKVSVLVSKNFDIDKSIGIGFEKFGIEKNRNQCRQNLVQQNIRIKKVFGFSVYKLVLALLNIIFQVLSNPLRLLHTDSFPRTSLSTVNINKDSSRWVGYVLVGMLRQFVSYSIALLGRNTRRQQKRNMNQIFPKIHLNKSSSVIQDLSRGSEVDNTLDCTLALYSPRIVRLGTSIVTFFRLS